MLNSLKVHIKREFKDLCYIINFLKDELKHEVNDLLFSIIFWFLPAFISFIVFQHYKSSGYFNYILKALNQGISVYLWNLMAGIGCIFFGIGILFPKNKTKLKLLKNSRNILLNTFKMGLLALGVLMGEALLFQGHFRFYTSWQKWFFDAAFLMMLIEAFFINLTLWVVAVLIYNPYIPDKKTKLIKKIEGRTVYRVLIPILILITFIITIFWKH
jgi:hypothetical protein